MQFSVPLMHLTKPLQQLLSISPSSVAADDITQNILISVHKNSLVLKASDYSIECSCVLDLDENDVKAEGCTTVNAAKLYGSCKNLDANSFVNFNHDEASGILDISCANCTFKVRTRSADEFPIFDIDDIEQTLVIKQKVLKSILDSTIFCVSTEDFREYLRGVRIEVNGDLLSVFSSDGHRMAVAETTISNNNEGGNFGVTLTKKFALELSKILKATDDEITLEFTKSAVCITCNNYRLISNLIVCGYPNVRAVIPKDTPISINLPRQQLRSVISRVSLLSSKRVNGVSLTFSKNKIDLRSENSEHEVASDSFAIEYDNKEFEISLNGIYINEILNALNSDYVTFSFAKELGSAIITPDVVSNEIEDEVKFKYIVSKVIV